mmetsp:Transcript_10966/g.40844  ORF Transcript_10966/g.40844 Transcript_10966/m.40844 type:complete len:734 (+) Transcript_10966:228-2429(+)
MTHHTNKEYESIVPIPSDAQHTSPLREEPVDIDEMVHHHSDDPQYLNSQRELEDTLTQLNSSTLDGDLMPGMSVGRDDMGSEEGAITNEHWTHLVNGVPESPHNQNRRDTATGGNTKTPPKALGEVNGEDSDTSISTPPHKDELLISDDNAPLPNAIPKDFPNPPENHLFFRIFFFFFWTFEWMTVPILRGVFSHPNIKDVPQLPKKLRAQTVNKKFSATWERYKNYPRPLLWCIARLIWVEYFLAGVCNLIMRSLDLVVPLMLAEMLKHLQYSSSDEIWKGYCWAAGIALTKLIWSVFMQYHLHYAVRCGMITRSGIVGLLYEKSLRMQRKQDEVMTLISVDVMKVDLSFQHFHFSWSSIFQIIVSVVFLSMLVGWATCAGLVVILCTVPIQYFVGKISSRFQKRALKWTDARVKIINEIVSGIQLMKFYAWENSYSNRVKRTRGRELKQILKVTMTRAVNSATMSIIPVLVSCATFTMYTLLGGELKVEVLFPAISYFELMRIPLTYFPIIVNNVINANVSLGRMEKYMRATEVDDALSPEFLESQDENHQDQREVAVRAVDATYEWPQFEEPTQKKSLFRRRKSTTSVDKEESSDQEIIRIENVNFQVEKGKLILIVGPVGSGKTSLLSAILGEMQRVSGYIEAKGTISYVPQTAFLRNATLRENILFSLPMDRKRYEDSLHFSGLEEDLRQLNGDLTEIGSRGINLSGGQKNSYLHCSLDIFQWGCVPL